MITGDDTGRANQKKRTRIAIVEACREIIRSGGPVTMPEVARSALVSEATAYRYFPDLASLLTQALVAMWPSPADALAPVADSRDPVERVVFACEFLLRAGLAYQGAVRAVISATITRPAPGVPPLTPETGSSPHAGPCGAVSPPPRGRSEPCSRPPSPAPRWLPPARVSG